LHFVKLFHFFQNISLRSQFMNYVQQNNLQNLVQQIIVQCFEARAANPEEFIANLFSSSNQSAENVQLSKENKSLKATINRLNANVRNFKQQISSLEQKLDNYRQRPPFTLPVEQETSAGANCSSSILLEQNSSPKWKIEQVDTLPIEINQDFFNENSPSKTKLGRPPKRKFVSNSSSIFKDFES
jgi:cell division protein FtsB